MHSTSLWWPQHSLVPQPTCWKWVGGTKGSKRAFFSLAASFSMKIFQSYMGTLSIQRPPMWASLRAGALPPAAEQSSADRCGGLWGSQSSDQLANKNIWSVLPWFRLSDEVQFPWTVVSWSLCGLLVFQNKEQLANKKKWFVLPWFKLSNEVQFPWTVVSWSLWRFAGLSELRAVLQAKNCLVFLFFNHSVHWRPIFLPGKKLG